MFNIFEYACTRKDLMSFIVDTIDTDCKIKVSKIAVNNSNICG